MTIAMDTPDSPSIPCHLCCGACHPVQHGLFDDRFGAPGTYAILRCAACGLEQTWPRLPAPVLTEYYHRYYNAGMAPGSAYRRRREGFLNSPLYRLWLRWDGDFAFHLRQGRGRLLDVGCNEGRGLAIFAQNGFAAEGLEINPEAAALARQRGFTVHGQPVEDFAPGAPYEVVVLSQVLEHAPEPLDMLRRVRECLAPRGELWLACPNAKSLWRRVFGRAWVNWHVPYHLWHFTPATLTRLLHQAGFEVTELITLTPAVWLAQSLWLALASRPGGHNRLIRTAPGTAALMLAARLFILPWFRQAHRQGRGDCLVLTARPLPSIRQGNYGARAS